MQQEIAQHFAIITQGTDSATMRQSTQILNQKLLNKAECIGALMHLAVGADDPNLNLAVRQLAAVELRKRIGKFWGKIPGDQRAAVRHALLEFAKQPQREKSLRNQVARVISAVAKVDIPKNEWTDLLPFIYMCCQNEQSADMREMGFYQIYALLDMIAEGFSQHLGHLMTLLERGLNDPSSNDVKTHALKAVAKLSDMIEPEDENTVTAFRALIPSIVNVLQHFLQLGMEEEVSVGIETFDNLIASDAPILSKHIPETIEFFVQISANQQFAEPIRVHALSFLMWAMIYKKNKIQRLKLLAPLIQHLMPIGSEPDPEDMDEDSASRLAFKVLNTIALTFPPQMFFPTLWEFVVQYAQNAHVGQRKAAQMAIATVSEGCSDYICNEFKMVNLLPVVISGLKDPDLTVRRAACIALASLATEMGTQVSEHHQELLPLVFELLNDPNERVRKVSLETLDTLLENLGAHIRVYLQPLMERLVRLLDGNDLEVLATITSAIGSAAHAANEDFRPFFQHVIPRLQAFMSLTNKDNEDEMILRGVATDAVAAIAVAVGPDMFAPYLQPMMELAMASLQINESHLPECSFCFFGMMAKVFGSTALTKTGNQQIQAGAFSPFLNGVIQTLFKSCQQEETDSFPDLEEEELEDMDDDDEDAGDAYSKSVAMLNAIAEEKETAVEALGVIFQSCTQEFPPDCFQQMLNIVQELCDHGHENVRKACVSTLFRVVLSLFELYHPEVGQQPTSAKAQIQFHENVAHVLKLTMAEVRKIYDEEEDKVVVSAMNSELLDLLKLMGPTAITLDGQQDQLMQSLLTLMQKKAPCQAEFDLDTEQQEQNPDEDEQEAEYDALVVSTTADLLGTLAQQLGASFLAYFTHFWPFIVRYYKPTKPVSDRSMTIGVMSEMINGMRETVLSAENGKYANEMLQLCMVALGDEDSEVRSNAAYATGLLIEFIPAGLVNFQEIYPLILQKLAPLFGQASEMPNIVDNACGAVCRMIMREPSLVPLDQVMPVVCRELPLKCDMNEYRPVMQCVRFLYNQSPQALQQSSGGNMENIFRGMVDVLSVPNLDGNILDENNGELRSELVRIVKAEASAVQSIIAGLKPENRDYIMKQLA